MQLEKKLLAYLAADQWKTKYEIASRETLGYERLIIKRLCQDYEIRYKGNHEEIT